MNNLRQKLEEYQAQHPHAYLRNIAKEFSCTEAELTACKKETIFLKNNIKSFLVELESLDEVMCLTRNDSCVHERKGIYANISFEGGEKHNIGLAVNADIDIRMFLNGWAFIFAINEEERQSFQFFNKQGEAIHKVFLTENSNKEAFLSIIEKFKIEPFEMQFEPAKPSRCELPDEEINQKLFQKDWANLKDTHDFFPMIMKHRVTRTQALRLAGEKFARKVEDLAIRKILELARDKTCEIMVFVGNKDCIQIHTGEVKNLVEARGWYNVMDEKFTMHLNDKDIAQCWVTVKPTVDGNVHALECFDANGEMIVQVFGKRKPNIPELPLWREIIAKI